MPLIRDPSVGAGPGTAIVLDPDEVAVDRVALALNVGPIRVAPPGPDWGDAAISAYMADQLVGSTAVDYRIPNRQVRIPLVLGADGPSEFDTQRLYLQGKVALIQREGGWLKRGGGLYADVVNATLAMPDQYGYLGVEADVVLTLECLPDFYGDEVELTVTGGDTGGGEYVGLVADVPGDHPARVRIVVTDESGNDQLGLLWGIRSRHYSAAATARLVYDAEAMTPLDAAVVIGDAVEHGSLAAGWTPVLSTDLFGIGPLTHTGSYRVWAACETGSATPPDVRLLWDVGDFTAPRDNAPKGIPAAGDTYLLDLGEIRIDPAPVGTHQWKGVIQAKGAAGGEDVSIYKLWLQPVDEGAGRVTYALDTDIGLGTYVAQDSFRQSSGALAGKTADVGGAWTGTGDTDDFTVDSTSHTVQRGVTGDSGSGPFPGRLAISGVTALTDQCAQVDFSHLGGVTGLSGAIQAGVVVRYVDALNYVIAMMDRPTGILAVFAVVAGGATPLATRTFGALGNGWRTIRLAAFASGTVAVWCGPTGASTGTPLLYATSPAVATGGALASGKPGFYDMSTGPVIVRLYDNFAAWAPTHGAAMFAGRATQVRHDGVIRESAAGGSYGPASSVIGDLPRLPPSGPESRAVEVFAKPSTGDLDQLPELSPGELGVQIYGRPCWLFRP
jgi:hypothetical protein